MEARVAPPILAAGGEYEPLRLPYYAKPRYYTPDFVLPNGIAIEVKGWFTSADRSKMLAVKAQYPKLDLRLVLASPNQYLTARKASTQAEWCDKHGFPWAHNIVPQGWIDEPFDAWSQLILDWGTRRKRAA